MKVYLMIYKIIIINKNRLLIYDKNQTGRLVITSVEYIPAQ